MQPDRHEITLSVNGTSYQRSVESRLLLSDFLRHELGLAGTHVGCEHGVCGACTVLLDGAAGALLPDARGAGQRPRACDRRGAGQRDRRAAPAAAGDP